MSATANDSPEIAIVVTTIGDGAFLDGFRRQADAEGLREKLRFYVIPDRKTPPQLAARCQVLFDEGYRMFCPTLDEQETYLARLGGLDSLIPYNSDNRRNVGYLMAYESGAEVVLSLDDDNLCVPGEYEFAEHTVVARETSPARVVNADTGWFNIMEMLELEPARTAYARGFPMSQRHRPVQIDYSEQAVNIRMNAGLWSKAPDVDGMTWLIAPVQVVRMKDDSVVLGERTWSPINTQNTALHRDVIPSYYFVRMGFVLNGITVDRYGDIFSGYFAQACLRHLGHSIRVGTPVAVHDRNSHAYLRDATQELGCILLLEDLLEWLPEARLEGSNYSEACLSLTAALEEEVEKRHGGPWSNETKSYFHHMAFCMRKWVSACRMLG